MVDDQHSEGAAERIELLVVDWHGQLRSKWLPIEDRDKLRAGELRLPISTQAQDIWGDDQDELLNLALSIGDPDGRCVPIESTWCRQPWGRTRRGSGGAAESADSRRVDRAGRGEQVLASLHELTGTPSDFDTRSCLERVLTRYREKALTPVVAIELEFYLFDAETRATGRPVIPRDLGIAGEPKTLQLYDPRVMRRAESVLDRIRDYADAMGVPARAMLSEFGAGQFEINLLHRDNALQAADEAVLLRQIIDNAAYDEGLLASFMAKPWTDNGGSGQHVHVSLVDEHGDNVFSRSPERLSHAVAGLLDTLLDWQLLFTPNANSFRRIQPDFFAPARCDWSHDHRGVAVRLPETDGPAARLEHRVAGADANPYLVLTAILGGMLDGIEARQAPAIAALQPGEKPHATRLTHDWLTAVERLAESAGATRLLGERFCRLYSRIKRHEAHWFNRQVTDVELQTYLSRL